MNAHPDYTTFTLDELRVAADTIDREKYPERYALIVAEINKRTGSAIDGVAGLRATGPAREAPFLEDHPMRIGWIVLAALMGTDTLQWLVLAIVSWDGVVTTGAISTTMLLGSIFATVRVLRLRRDGLWVAAVIQALQLISISTPEGGFRLDPMRNLGAHSHVLNIGSGSTSVGISIVPLISLALVLLLILKSPPSKSDRPAPGRSVP